MGMDGVELVMEVEDAFQISIQDREVEHIRTVGDIYALVRLKTKSYPEDRCLSSHVFYRIRRAIPLASRFRPSTPLNEVLPLNARRAEWPQISAVSGLNLPPLTRSSRITSSIVAVSGALSLSLGIAAGTAAMVELGFIIGFGAFVFLVWMFVVATRPLALHVASATTLGDFSRLVLYRNFAKIAAECNATHHRELWNAVARIVAEEFGVHVNEIHSETRLVEDLNMG